MSDIKKVAFLGDSHYKESSRFDECCEIHDWIALDCANRSIDLVCHAGDVYDGKSTPAERRAVADFIKRITDNCPIVIVRGNHDVVGDLSLLGRLETKYPVVIEETAGVHTVEGLTVACMAWPRKAELMAAHAVLTTKDCDMAAATRDLICNILRGFKVNGRAPDILLAHAMVSGSKTSTGQELIGCDFELGLEDLALAGAPLVALGHIHKPQEWYHDGITICYTGSPRRTNYGETEEKSYMIAEFADGKLINVKRIPTPARQLITVETQYVSENYGISGVSESGFLEYSTTDCINSEVRFRYQVDTENRELAKAEAEKIRDKLIDLGALECKIEEIVIPSVKARLPEITTAQTIEDKLRLYWTSRGETLDENRIATLFDKVRELESEQ